MEQCVVNAGSVLIVLQFKEFLGTYNKVTENCFMDCVKDFTSRDVKPDEVNRKLVFIPRCSVKRRQIQSVISASLQGNSSSLGHSRTLRHLSLQQSC